MPGKPVYPDILTDADWQKKKGVFAKLVKGETGIGAALIKLKGAFDKVEWQYFDPGLGGPLPKPRTHEALEQRLNDAKAKGQPQVEEVRKMCFSVRDLCKKVGDEWAKSSVIPKSSREHVQQKMTKACEDLALALKSMDLKAYDNIRGEIDRVENAAKLMLQGWVDRLTVVIPKVKTTATVAFYNANMHQQVRGLGTAISKLEKYKPLYESDKWKEKTGDGFMKGVTDGEPVKAKVLQIETALTKLKAAMK